MMRAYIHTKENDGNAGYCAYMTQSTEVKRSPLWWHEKGLSFTASGYGSRIPTEYMVKYNGKWRRVYCIRYSNAGSLFIGKKYTPNLTVSIE